MTRRDPLDDLYDELDELRNVRDDLERQLREANMTIDEQHTEIVALSREVKVLYHDRSNCHVLIGNLRRQVRELGG